MTEVASPTLATERHILHHTRGSNHGPITRLVSPGDLGEVLKPFIFLDRFESPADGQAPQFGMHPHSGIATLTYLIEGRANYEDTTGEEGARGVLPQGGVEWMMAGGGVWHKGGPANRERVLGFQLWVAMPPELELAEAYSRYLDPADIAHVGPARVLLGGYDGATSPIPAPSNMTYLGIHLQGGQTWHFEPPSGHTVAWAAIGEGSLSAPDALRTGDMVVFAPGAGPITFEAQEDTAFVIGSAMPHPHPLHMGSYSVHTNQQALTLGEAGIRNRARLLRQQGRL
jgi:redox-sensitive bicupin YhaK (pirin superfamily)